MRKLYALLLVLILCMVCTFALAADRTITVDMDEVLIYARKFAAVTAEVTALTEDAPANTQLVWETSDKTVANVANGRITGVKEGEAVITVSAKDDPEIKAEIKVTVVTPLQRIALNANNVALKVGANLAMAQVQPQVTFTPDNAYNKNVVWSSSNEAIATVDENGLVTAHAAGRAVITCTPEDTSAQPARCNLNVTEALVIEVSDFMELVNAVSGITKDTYIRLMQDIPAGSDVWYDDSGENKVLNGLPLLSNSKAVITIDLQGHRVNARLCVDQGNFVLMDAELTQPIYISRMKDASLTLSNSVVLDVADPFIPAIVCGFNIGSVRPNISVINNGVIRAAGTAISFENQPGKITITNNGLIEAGEQAIRVTTDNGKAVDFTLHNQGYITGAEGLYIGYYQRPIKFVVDGMGMIEGRTGAAVNYGWGNMLAKPVSSLKLENCLKGKVALRLRDAGMLGMVTVTGLMEAEDVPVQIDDFTGKKFPLINAQTTENTANIIRVVTDPRFSTLAELDDEALAAQAVAWQKKKAFGSMSAASGYCVLGLVPNVVDGRVVYGAGCENGMVLLARHVIPAEDGTYAVQQVEETVPGTAISSNYSEVAKDMLCSLKKTEPSRIELADDVTLKLYGNAVLDNESKQQISLTDVVIDGNGHTLEFVYAGNGAHLPVLYDVALQNVSLVMSGESNANVDYKGLTVDKDAGITCQYMSGSDGVIDGQVSVERIYVHGTLTGEGTLNVSKELQIMAEADEEALLDVKQTALAALLIDRGPWKDDEQTFRYPGNVTVKAQDIPYVRIRVNLSKPFGDFTEEELKAIALKAEEGIDFTASSGPDGAPLKVNVFMVDKTDKHSDWSGGEMIGNIY